LWRNEQAEHLANEVEQFEGEVEKDEEVGRG